MEPDWKQIGENTAGVLCRDGAVGGRRTARRVRSALRMICAVRNRVAEYAHSCQTVPQAAEWLLDNWYLAQREGQDGADAFRRAVRLPCVRREGRREPLVLELARGFTGGAGVLTLQGLAAFLEGAQRVRPLTERELSLLVPALKCALTERLELLCARLVYCLGQKDLSADDLAGELEQNMTSFRTLSSASFHKLLEKGSLIEQALRRDPAGLYGQMDDETRARYRRKLCQLAKQQGISEEEAADCVLKLCTAAECEQEMHVGWHLFRRPLGRLPRGGRGKQYICAVVFTTLLLVLLLAIWLHSGVVALLLLLPVSDIVKNSIDFLVTRCFQPRPVHRMSLRDGIPAEGKTLCVIAGLLTDEKSGGAYAALLERYRLANRDAGDQIAFGILADLPDRARPMGSVARRWVRAAQEAVDGLNQVYGGGFYLFFRPPVFQPVDEHYQGWERKRGALLELARLLKGRRTGLFVQAGDRKGLHGVKFVITLDSDTSLNVGSARELVGAMLHPLNRAQVDKRRRIVTAGYGVLQPRVGVELNAANKSQFSRIFAGQGGVDPYGSTTSDVYHDLFDQGTYTGKGIFDVDAFLTCLDGRFPENTILSHDLLEGSYLHAGLIGDVELTDSYPYKVTSYYARLHRWVRGDWQLLPWLGRRVKNQAGETERNPISLIAKWKIFDNLRRSLSPFCTLLALLLGMCLAGVDFGAAAGVAILAAASNLLLSGAELAFRRGQGLRARYYSTIIAGFGGVLLQTLVQLLFLPLHGATCAAAIATALWRSMVSHRGRLAWVTAADTEKCTGDGIWACYRKQWPAVLVGLAAMAFSIFPAGAAVGLVWALSPVFAWAMSRPLSCKRPVPVADRAFLLHEGALIWRYFADFLRPEDHYLPPDNWQEQPAAGLARRTSPTNIGMALLCCLAAADLDFITRKQAAALIGHQLDTLEALPKWHGHLYNWYDTVSAQPLTPRYCSTVDGGNLCGSLIALREGLYEWGEDVLARRAECISDGMDFSLLFDRDRKLFYIGYDVEKKSYTQGWYDLMASEARQTSYIAVARGEVEPRHWRRLGRMLSGDNDYSGMASWTGTMFEYFMPNLLLPCEPNSLMYESLAFCIYEQKRRVAKRGSPWGTSESGFYAFDGGLSYQYKAHGVQKLGLKRGLDTELVISPYSSFLALLLAPGSAGRNLRRLRDLGVEGKYGLYEALDYTPARLTGDMPFEPVRSFMAHHLGMSLVAIDNALHENVMQERFMRDCSMSAYRELLQEKVPVGASIMKSPHGEVPSPLRRHAATEFIREGEGQGRPVCHLVSNGAYTVMCAANGKNQSRMGSTTLTTEHGITFYVSTEHEFLTLDPDHFRFDASARWTTQVGALTATHTLRVPDRENGEVRDVTLHWTGGSELRGELVCYLEPLLAKELDYLAHPAFSKLFLESAYTGDGVLFTRRPRREEEGNPAMAVLWDADEAFFDTSREIALGRGGLRALEQALKGPAHSTAGPVLDPCLLVRIPLALAPGETRRFRFALAASDSREDAVRAALRLLHGPAKAESLQTARLIAVCKLTREQAVQAYELLTKLEYPSKKPIYDQRTLWPFGISGDLPIAVVEIDPQANCFWMGCHKLLTLSGYAFDLVFLLDEGGDYRRPVRSALTEALTALDWTHKLGVAGGIHLVDGGTPVLEAATVNLNHASDETLYYSHEVKQESFVIEPGIPQWETGPDGTFTFHTGPRLPPVGWSQMLTNGGMGWMPDETGCGHLWLDNAREHQLTPWYNDPLAVGGPERFRLRGEAGECALFADGDGLPCRVTYGPGFARWEKTWGAHKITTTAFIPMEENTRILIVDYPGGPAQISHRIDGQAEMLYKIDGTMVLKTNAEGTAVDVDGNAARKSLNRTVMYWNRQVSTLKVHTKSPALDAYLNGWALYQVIACRLLGRTSRYQNGGAYGFRDQLQDSSATLLITGALARAQLLRACAHQFEEGDVQHWWHEVGDGAGKGVRTRISDDLLWLPYILCEYLEKRGDDGLLTEEVPYLSSPVLGDGEEERYEEPRVSALRGTVYEHAVRAVECVLLRGTGAHDLALIGTGDWNDGMNRVGSAGRGESVWLTWFTAIVLERFAPVCDRMGEEMRGARYREAAVRLAGAANAAWDGNWFLRGYYDDGDTLGSARDEGCQIDSIAQSFSALAPHSDRKKSETAVRAALDQLFDQGTGVVKLLDPAFDGGDQDPGYIKGYLPGVRENGGQYTHAAVWLALGALSLGMVREGWDVLHALLPANHPPEVYRAEPFVLAADVYSNPLHAGRGGWSWYTGAAGWYYKTAVEQLLGITLRQGRLFLHPKLPEDWPGYSATWRTDRATFHIIVRRGAEKGTLLNGKSVQAGVDMARCQGEHTIERIF